MEKKKKPVMMVFGEEVPQRYTNKLGWCLSKLLICTLEHMELLLHLVGKAI